MLAEIIVTNPTPDTETSLFKFSYVHSGCSEENMNWSRDLINDICIIECTCGLKVSFPQRGEASTKIAHVTIDGKSRNLPNESFTAFPNQIVRFHSFNVG